MRYANLIGHKVVYVEGAGLWLADGSAWEFTLDADCCSHSAFTVEGLAALKELTGSTILEVEDRDGGVTGEANETHEASKGDVPAWAHNYNDDYCQSWHFLVFKTDRGHVTVDWRNESNGYYDGSCYLNPSAKRLSGPCLDAALEGRVDLVAAAPDEARFITVAEARR